MVSLLDVVLFLRVNASALNITHLQQIVLINIASRVGKNKDTWIRQKNLAQESCTSTRHLIRALKHLSALNLIKTERNGRSNRYSLDEKYMTPVSPIEVEYMTPMSPNNLDTCHPCHLLSDEKIAASPATSGLEEIAKTPKETLKQIDNKIKQTKVTHVVEKLELPIWLNKEHWEEFLEFRKSLKAAMSLLAQKKAFSALSKLRDEGHDVDEVIDQSIVSGWKGLFPVKKSINQHKPTPTPAQAQHSAYLARLTQQIRETLAYEASDAIVDHEVIPNVFGNVPAALGYGIG